MADGTERPIAYASKSLSSAEKNYAQIDKEALAIVFGVKRFHANLYGRRFTLITDHKPLLAILGPKSGIPPLAAARMQRWAQILTAYDYELEFRKTELHGNADALSRFPLESSIDSALPPAALYHFEFFDAGVTEADVCQATRQDPMLKEVFERLKFGWKAEDSSSHLAEFFRKRLELSIEGGLILWGRRVVIPESLRSRVLALLHEDHLGIVKMKAVA